MENDSSKLGSSNVGFNSDPMDLVPKGVENLLQSCRAVVCDACLSANDCCCSAADADEDVLQF